MALDLVSSSDSSIASPSQRSNEQGLQPRRPIPLRAHGHPASGAVEPIDEVEASLDAFGVEKGREFGEENRPVKGAKVLLLLWANGSSH